MKCEKLQIRAGALLSFEVERANPSAISATFIAKLDDTVISLTVAYNSDGVAVFELGSPDTDIVGVYDWQINENFESGSPDKYPILEGGKFPKLHIYEALSDEE